MFVSRVCCHLSLIYTRVSGSSPMEMENWSAAHAAGDAIPFYVLWVGFAWSMENGEWSR